MRGKISYYNENTHTGMVVDKAKVGYEFKGSIWYDQHRLPAADMYVDFKANDHGRVEQIKESAFLKLLRKYDLTEDDFWQSADEEALEEIGIARREAMINDGILLMQPAQIKEDYPISDCFLAFFADAVELIYKYEELAFDERGDQGQIDYSKLKRFLQKAKSQLLQYDGSISAEPFNKMENELSEIEFVANEVLKQKNKTAEELFEEIYLAQQIGYLRAEKRTKLDSQRLFELNEIIKRGGGSSVSASQEARTVEQNRALFERYVKQFKESKFNEFIGSFGFETELKGVMDALNTIMNRIAYNYDTMLWQNAINSHIVVGTFFRQATEGNYCAATFLRYYLKPLNKRALNKTDEALYNYLLKYDNLIAKHILVLSDNKSAADTAAMAVYKSFKDAVAHRFLRAADSLFHIRQSRAELALFDEQNRTLSVNELAQSYVEAHGSQRFHILVFNARKQSVTIAFDSVEIIRTGGCDEKIISDKIIEILG